MKATTLYKALICGKGATDGRYVVTFSQSLDWTLDVLDRTTGTTQTVRGHDWKSMTDGVKAIAGKSSKWVSL